MKYLKMTILSLFFIFAINTVCYADEVVIDLPNFDSIMQEFPEYPYYFISIREFDQSSDNWVAYLYLSKGNTAYSIYESPRPTYPRHETGYYLEHSFLTYSCNLGDTEWTFKHTSGFAFIGCPNNPYGHELLYSNTDLFLNGETVFHEAPIQKGLLRITRFQIMAALKQVAYLVPCLISCLIGLIALRKCWSWLKTQLQT